MGSKANDPNSHWLHFSLLPADPEKQDESEPQELEFRFYMITLIEITLTAMSLMGVAGSMSGAGDAIIILVNYSIPHC